MKGMCAGGAKGICGQNRRVVKWLLIVKHKTFSEQSNLVKYVRLVEAMAQDRVVKNS